MLADRRHFLQQLSALIALGACGGPGSFKVYGAESEIPLGPNADLGGRLLMPAGDAWNRDVSGEEVDPNSDALIESIGADKPLHEDFGAFWEDAPLGIQYHVVSGDQPRVPVTFDEAAEESDPGPYPIPPDVVIEGGPNGDGDRHVIVLDRDNMKVYELFNASTEDGGKSWRAGSGAIFDLKKPKPRPAGWTSADAAGLPILPGLARYDEIVGAGELRHALRFTVSKTRHAYIPPARHYASDETDPSLPPMGMRVRLKADFDVSGFEGPARVIVDGLKKYGMILADNGSDWFVSGAHDPRWVQDELVPLRQIKGSDFEVVKMKGLVTR
ncbi:MAG: hypothetical protein C0483_18210 [Pirellula sp.]|nr:hypothetical protein [Pirellula sp.]